MGPMPRLVVLLLLGASVALFAVGAVLVVLIMRGSNTGW